MYEIRNVDLNKNKVSSFSSGGINMIQNKMGSEFRSQFLMFITENKTLQ